MMFMCMYRRYSPLENISIGTLDSALTSVSGSALWRNFINTFPTDFRYLLYLSFRLDCALNILKLYPHVTSHFYGFKAENTILISTSYSLISSITKENVYVKLTIFSKIPDTWIATLTSICQHQKNTHFSWKSF